MSRVQSFEEIQRFPVPTPETFARELDDVRDGLSNMHNRGILSGAIIFGSAAYGGTKPGSDIDIIVASPEVSLELMDEMGGMVSRVYNRSGIPLDPVCRTERELRTGEHGLYQRPMIGWLHAQAERFPANVIGDDLISIMQPPRVPAAESAAMYLSNTVRILGRMYMQGSTEPERALEGAINAPHKTGRESVSALQDQGCIPVGTLQKADRVSVAKAVKVAFGEIDPTIPELGRQLGGAFDVYNELVESVRRGEVDKSTYISEVIEAAKVGLPKAVMFAARMQAAHRTLCESKG